MIDVFRGSSKSRDSSDSSNSSDSGDSSKPSNSSRSSSSSDSSDSSQDSQDDQVRLVHLWVDFRVIKRKLGRRRKEGKFWVTSHAQQGKSHQFFQPGN